ncbi:MAG: hypothetical protein EAZ88_24590 [Oscillatoriales cyanobacterium]|nr:MAG: hypothetical protein EAZ88_24590 [Oscillatoriales cyanobacterium]
MAQSIKQLHAKIQVMSQPLSEEQTIAMSLAALEDYQKSKTGISGDRVKEWADSLGITLS